MNSYLIVTGGQIDDSFAIRWINEHSFEGMIASDSGMEFYKRAGLKPDMIIGDFDSVKAETLDSFRNKDNIQWIKLNPMKDDTDTEAAIRLAIENGAEDITLLGATGSRIDHMLANIELLGIGLERKIPMQIIDANNRIRMIDSGIVIREAEQFGRYVSLIPYSMEVKNVTLKGFKYTLENYTMHKFNSLGISNEIAADEARISFTDGIMVVIEAAD